MRVSFLLAFVLVLGALPAAEAAPTPGWHCSPGFGGGQFCWIWTGTSCEIAAYLPPTPIFPGPGDPLPYVHAYDCGATCYTDVEQGGEQCMVSPAEGCEIRARTGPLPDDQGFGTVPPSIEANGCAPAPSP